VIRRLTLGDPAGLGPLGSTSTCAAWTNRRTRAGQPARSTVLDFDNVGEAVSQKSTPSSAW